MISYDFTHGRYRARVKTTYKRADMSMNDSIYSNAYEFTVALPVPKQYLTEIVNTSSAVTDEFKYTETITVSQVT